MSRSVFRWLLYVLLFNGLAITVTCKAVAEEADQQELSQAQLDQILAPIALYPDALLSHILIAATYPLEVVMADRWAKDHPELSGDEAINAADNEDWDPSVKALVAFPEVLKRMSENLDWTEELGEAFLADEKVVLDSVQNLRQHAYDEGTLNDAEHIRVVKEETQIIIEPRVREVIYVPYYDTRVVYGSWWWSSYPPVYWHDYYSYSRPVYWGPRVSLSWGFYFSDVRWSHRHIVVVNRSHFHRPVHYRDYSVSRHRHAQHWQHQVQHRRGVTYHNRGVHERYSRSQQRTTMSTPTEFTTRLKEPRSTRYTTENNRERNQHHQRDNKSASNRESRDHDVALRSEQRSEKTNRKQTTDQPRARDGDNSREQRLLKADSKPNIKSSNDKPRASRQNDDRSNQKSNEHPEPRLTNKFSGGVARDHSTREDAERSARNSSAQRSSRQESSQRASHESSRQRSSAQSFSPSRSSRESSMRSSSRESYSRQSSSRQSDSRQSGERMRMSGGSSRNRDTR